MAPLRIVARSAVLAVGLAMLPGSSPVTADTSSLQPAVGTAVRFDVTPPLQDMPIVSPGLSNEDPGERDGATGVADATAAEPAVAAASGAAASAATRSMPGPVRTFEGIANADNPIMVSPPDPVGDIGMDHYVEMVNETFAVYAKDGTRLFGPAALGTIWQGFLPDCQDNSGDPIVLYDEIANRWLLSQFTTRGPEFFNCVALSTTSNPLGSYFRYAFSTGLNFPDYPKYAVWPDAYYITTREFDANDRFVDVGVYAIERGQMLDGNPSPRQVTFLLDRSKPWLVGDGLLAGDFDGRTHPQGRKSELLVGTMDAGGPYGAPFDGLNVFRADIHWAGPQTSTLTHVKSIPISGFDTIFPCAPTSRSCIAQPGTSNKIDILSYRQRPTWRLAYRNFGDHESLVTNQSVEAAPDVAGVRWWELRNPDDPVLFQEGIWAPGDDVQRWMGSAAMDSAGDLAIGYSVSNATSVFPGIRYAGRLPSDAPGTLGQGEAVLIDGAGSQTVSARWGDYTSLNVDPRDQCTFWYVNEYYATSSARGWQTRIGAFRFPKCGS
jgi:hypothetical protein